MIRIAIEAAACLLFVAAVAVLAIMIASPRWP